MAEKELNEFRKENHLLSISVAEKQELITQNLSAAMKSQETATGTKRRKLDKAISIAKKEAFSLEPLAIAETRLYACSGMLLRRSTYRLDPSKGFRVDLLKSAWSQSTVLKSS